MGSIHVWRDVVEFYHLFFLPEISSLLRGFGIESLFLTLPIFQESFLPPPGHFSLKTKKSLQPPPSGLLIGIYIFYENWSTETFRKSQRGGLIVLRVNRISQNGGKDDGRN
jgi:uncharacterized RDD family membrane protein YckC